MSGSSKTDWTGVFLGLLVLVCAANAFIAFTRPIPQIQPPCDCKPTATPAPCCKADECRQELAKVDARFGGVWDELVEVQEQLAKLKPCGCGPVKECCCEPGTPDEIQKLWDAVRPLQAGQKPVKCGDDCKCTGKLLPNGSRSIKRDGCWCKCELCPCPFIESKPVAAPACGGRRGRR